MLSASLLTECSFPSLYIYSYNCTFEHFLLFLNCFNFSLWPTYICFFAPVHSCMLLPNICSDKVVARISTQTKAKDVEMQIKTWRIKFTWKEEEKYDFVALEIPSNVNCHSYNHRILVCETLSSNFGTSSLIVSKLLLIQYMLIMESQGRGFPNFSRDASQSFNNKYRSWEIS